MANASVVLAAGRFAVVFLCYSFGLIALALGGTISIGAAVVTVWVASRDGLSRRNILKLVILNSGSQPPNATSFGGTLLLALAAALVWLLLATSSPLI